MSQLVVPIDSTSLSGLCHSMSFPRKRESGDWTFSMCNPGSLWTAPGAREAAVPRGDGPLNPLANTGSMRFPAFPSNPKRRRTRDRRPSLAAAARRTLQTQRQASLAEHTDSTRSVCLTGHPWERGRLARPEATEGRCSGLRPRLRTGRPRSQGIARREKSRREKIAPNGRLGVYWLQNGNPG